MMKSVRQLLSIMFLLLWSPWTIAAVSAHLSRNIVFEGEQLTLTIRVEGDSRNDRPDLSPLDADFKIVGNGKSEQFTRINGKTSRVTEWQIALVPKKIGEFEVPPLNVGHEVTYPLQLKVTPMADLDPDDQAPLVFIEAELDNHSPYVLQQIILTVKLYVGAELKEGTLSEPEHQDLMAESLGDQTRYDELKYGRRYSVIVRRYALFAQQSGALEIAPITFNGTIVDTDSRSSAPQFYNPIFGQYPNSIRKFSTQSQSIALTVKPNPSQQTYHWMPAESVKMSQEWSQPLKDLKIGEPVTRTIKVEVEGQRGSQIDLIELGEIPGWQIYPDQANSDTQTHAAGVTGKLERKFALIPEKGGRGLMPAVQLHWWDTISDQARVTELAAESFSVSGAANTVSNVPQPASADTPRPLSTMNVQLADSQSIAPTKSATDTWQNFNWRLLAFASLAGWLLTLAYFLKPKLSNVIKSGAKANADKHSFPIPNSLRTDPYLAPALEACENQDLKGLQISLIRWANHNLAERSIDTLNDLSGWLHQTEFKQMVEALDANLYGHNQTQLTNVSPSQLKHWMLTESKLRMDRSDDKNSRLPPLYPN